MEARNHCPCFWCLCPGFDTQEPLKRLKTVHQLGPPPPFSFAALVRLGGRSRTGSFVCLALVVYRVQHAHPTGARSLSLRAMSTMRWRVILPRGGFSK